MIEAEFTHIAIPGCSSHRQTATPPQAEGMQVNNGDTPHNAVAQQPCPCPEPHTWRSKLLTTRSVRAQYAPMLLCYDAVHSFSPWAAVTQLRLVKGCRIMVPKQLLAKRASPVGFCSVGVQVLVKGTPLPYRSKSLTYIDTLHACVVLHHHVHTHACAALARAHLLRAGTPQPPPAVQHRHPSPLFQTCSHTAMYFYCMAHTRQAHRPRLQHYDTLLQPEHTAPLLLSPPPPILHPCREFTPVTGCAAEARS